MISKTIWQTYETPISDLPLLAQQSLETWKNLNPGWSHGYMSGADREDFFRTEFGGEVFETYMKYPMGVMKAGQVGGNMAEAFKYGQDVAKTGTSARDMANARQAYPKIAKAGEAAVELGEKVGPKAAAVANSPLTKMALKMGIPLELLLRSGELNADEEEELAKRRKMAPTITPKKP
jgi:hypothetical protein